MAPQPRKLNSIQEVYAILDFSFSDPVTESSIRESDSHATVLQCYSVTVLQCYTVTVLQCHSVTVLQCYSVTVVQCYSVTVLQYHRPQC